MSEGTQENPFKKINEIEYEVQLGGRTKVINVPFAITEKVFQAFVMGGGVIDPVTGQVQQDLMQLIASFKELGNILLSEFDDEGRLLKEGNCARLSTSDVMTLFKLATHVVESFIQTLIQMQPPKGQPEEANAEASPKKG